MRDLTFRFIHVDTITYRALTDTREVCLTEGGVCMIGTALEIAWDAHKGQTDKA